MSVVWQYYLCRSEFSTHVVAPARCIWRSAGCSAFQPAGQVHFVEATDTMAMNRIFRCFRIIHVSLDSLHFHFELFRFWLRICRDIHNRKSTPWLTEWGSRRLHVSVGRGVAYWIFKRKLPISVSQRIVNSPHPWYSESPTHRMGESTSRYLIKFYNMKKNP